MKSSRKPKVQVSYVAMRELLRRPISFHAVFADVAGGVAEGVFLSQLVYWSETMYHSKRDKKEDWDGWFYKTNKEWYRETRLKRRQIEAAQRNLEEAGVISMEVRGVPPRTHYRLNLDSLIDALSNIDDDGVYTPKKQPRSTESDVQNDKLKMADRTNLNGTIVQIETDETPNRDVQSVQIVEPKTPNQFAPGEQILIGTEIKTETNREQQHVGAASESSALGVYVDVTPPGPLGPPAALIGMIASQMTEVPADDSPAAVEGSLVAAGISGREAGRLVSRYGVDACRAQLEALPFRVGPTTKNVGGLLAESIRENYAIPAKIRQVQVAESSPESIAARRQAIQQLAEAEARETAELERAGAEFELLSEEEQDKFVEAALEEKPFLRRNARAIDGRWNRPCWLAGIDRYRRGPLPPATVPSEALPETSADDDVESGGEEPQ